jgi:hypothetical protein
MGFATILVAFNDVFFMSLMFFLSGLFFWPSLARKGSVFCAALGLSWATSAALRRIPAVARIV